MIKKIKGDIMENMLNNIGKVQNSKQSEYLSKIRDIGMGIIFGQTTPEIYIETFESYIDYMEKPSQYLQTLKMVSKKIANNDCTPDDLLLAMAKHTLEIEYEDEVYEYDEYEDDYENDEDDNIIVCGFRL